MTRPGDLEKYLRLNSEAGQTTDTDLPFSIAREKALEKLAAFQLPLEGAWALKIVQCAVACGSATSVKVDLVPSETRFTFYGTLEFSLSDVEEAFYAPDYSSRTDLCHLMTALRERGYHNKRPFWLSIGDESEALFWDGESMVRLPTDALKSGAEPRALHLIVSADPKGEKSGFLSRAGSKLNAELIRVLSNQACLCPIPLLVDGRRVDALQNDPQNGWSSESQLLLMGFEDGPFPILTIPQNTWNHVVNAAIVERSFQKGYQKQSGATTLKSNCSIAWLLSAHLKQRGKGWTYVLKTCSLNWVKDGVVICREPLTENPQFISVACFVSAEAIPTDLTGFQLQNHEERSRRKKECAGVIGRALEQAEQFDFNKVQKDARTGRRWEAGFTLLMGAFMVAAAPATPVVGLMFGGFGVLCLFHDDGEAETRRDQINHCVQRIREEL